MFHRVVVCALLIQFPFLSCRNSDDICLPYQDQTDRPYFVIIFNHKYRCGGGLINPYWVLTDSECLETLNALYMPVDVRAGMSPYEYGHATSKSTKICSDQCGLGMVKVREPFHKSMEINFLFVPRYYYQQTITSADYIYGSFFGSWTDNREVSLRCGAMNLKDSRNCWRTTSKYYKKHYLCAEHRQPSRSFPEASVQARFDYLDPCASHLGGPLVSKDNEVVGFLVRESCESDSRYLAFYSVEANLAFVHSAMGFRGGTADRRSKDTNTTDEEKKKSGVGRFMGEMVVVVVMVVMVVWDGRGNC